MSKFITIKVVNALYNKQGLTMYTDTGESVHLPPEHKDIERLLKELSRISTGVPVDITYDTSKGSYNPFKHFISSVVKFFTASGEPMDQVFEYTPQTKIVAKVGDREIPNVEQVASLVNTAVQNGQPIGVENLFKRLVDMTDVQVQSLLKFINKGDLIITNNGDILGLRRVDKKEDYFVDMHSGRVKQTIGTLVYMDRDMVDPNSHNHCSVGLHVATRTYLKGWNSNATFLVVFRPEDVCVVPDDRSDKIRVCAYQNLIHLTDEDVQLFNKGSPYSDLSPGFVSEVNEYINNGIPAPTSTTYINRDNTITHKVVNSSNQLGKVPTYRSTKAIDVTAPDKKPPVTVSKAKAITQKTHKERINEMVDNVLLRRHKDYASDLAQLESYRKQIRRSYASLGVPAPKIKQIQKLISKLK